MTQIVLDPSCPKSHEAFLAHHNVELSYDDDYHDWGLYWKHGVMGSISRKPERAEAAAIASLFIHWWLTLRGERCPGQLIRAAWFFHNPDALPPAKEKHGTDPDAAPMFQFVDEQLALYEKRS